MSIPWGPWTILKLQLGKTGFPSVPNVLCLQDTYWLKYAMHIFLVCWWFFFQGAWELTWGSSRRLLAPDANWLFQPQIVHFLFGTKKNLTQAQIIHVRHPFFVKGNLWQLCDLHLASEERTSRSVFNVFNGLASGTSPPPDCLDMGPKSISQKNLLTGAAWGKWGITIHLSVMLVAPLRLQWCYLLPNSPIVIHGYSWYIAVSLFTGSSRVTPIWNRMGARWSLSVVGHRLSEVKIHGKYWQDVFRWCAWAVNGHDGHVRLYPSNVFPADFHSPNLILT